MTRNKMLPPIIPYPFEVGDKVNFKSQDGSMQNGIINRHVADAFNCVRGGCVIRTDRGYYFIRVSEIYPGRRNHDS